MSVLAFLPSFLYSQFFVTPPKPTFSFASKTVIVTGSNTGIGRDAARHYVHLGAERVILAVRSLDKGNAAKKWIEENEKDVLQGRSEVVQVWELDMSSFASVKAFATRCETQLDRLDVLAANAGINTNQWILNEGFESTITVNVISTFLLSFLLLPLLKKTALAHGTKSVCAITSSEVHEFASFREKSAANIFDELNRNKAAAGQDRYVTSKLLEVLIVREFVASQLGPDPKEYPVIFNFSNPGLCASELVRDWRIVVWPLFALVARTTEVGSRVLVFAGGEAGVQSQGGYISDARIKEPGHWVRTDEGVMTGRRVWEELVAILEGASPGVTKNF